MSSRYTSKESNEWLRTTMLKLSIKSLDELSSITKIDRGSLSRYFKPIPKSRHALNRYLDKLKVNIHSLRKTYTYILRRNGIHVTTAQKLMGHASPRVTMRIYTAVLVKRSMLQV